MTNDHLPGTQDCNCFAVRAAARRISQLYDQLLAPVGLRVTQFSVLAKLKRLGPMTINTLAENMVMDRTTLGRNVLPLQRDGLIRIGESDTDRRAKVLRLTKTGEKRLQAGIEAWSKAQTRFEHTFGAGRTEQLRKLLHAVVSNEFTPDPEIAGPQQESRGVPKMLTKVASPETAAEALATDIPGKPRFDQRTRVLIEGPIAVTLIRLAAPNVLVMLAQTAVGLVETYFVGKLGTDALAGVALVFPLVMLMQMMSAGGMGGGISSAIARALGAGRRADANALVLHALVIAIVFGLAFTIGLLTGGHFLYAAMGGNGAALDAALIYSDVVFTFAILVWLFNSLANVIRGTGNMAFPAIVTCVGVIVLVPLSPCLIFGWGPFPRLGVAGGAVAVVIYYAIGTAALAAYLRSPRSIVRLALVGIRLRWALFRDILRVGLVAALITVQTNVTIAIATGLVGMFGAAAIAGYGTASRLEYLLIPLVFGLGGPLVAMVGTNIGAGHRDRALRVAWIGAAIATAICEIIGVGAALAPKAWLSLFDSDPAMIEAGSRYLHAVGPVYGLFGLGMALYFASQGAGRLLWPLLANFVRLIIAAGGGWLALRLTSNLTDVFIALAIGLAAFGLINAAAVAGGAWFPRSSTRQPKAATAFGSSRP